MKQLNLAIRERFYLPPAYHMTHIENLESIFRSGAILCRNRAGQGPIVDISNPEVQAWRSHKVIPISERTIHDYVPLYFGFKTPMVACVQSMNAEIVFLRYSLNILGRPGVIVSDGNARSTMTRFRAYSRLEDLDFLDVKAILGVKYAHDPEIKRRKQAEILVPELLDFENLLDIIAFSSSAGDVVMSCAQRARVQVKVRVDRGWYFDPMGGA